MRQSEILRRISHGIQSAQGDLFHSRLLSVIISLRQECRVISPFLEQVWIRHHRSGEMPSLLPDPR